MYCTYPDFLNSTGGGGERDRYVQSPLDGETDDLLPKLIYL